MRFSWYFDGTSEFYSVQADLMVNVLDASLPGAHVAALQAQGRHASQGQLSQVALLHPRADQGHGNISLQGQTQQLVLYPPIASIRHNALMVEKRP